MKNLFKKKKSDSKLAPQPIQYDTTPKKPIVLADTPLQAPPLMMPKPKRALTPTRAILGRFDNDKTEVEDSPLQDISPILLPIAHHDSNPPPPSKSLHQHLSTLSVTGSDDSSRVYESAVESPSTSSREEEIMDLPEFPPEAALAQKQLEMQQKFQQQQQELEQQKKKLDHQNMLEKEAIKQHEFKRQQEFARQQQELERQQELKRQQQEEQQLARQQEEEEELAKQQEIERQNELERQDYIKRQKQLELEHIKAQLQFQEHQYHEQQFEQQKQQFLLQQSGISDASSRTISPRHQQISSASSATATPMIQEQEILYELKRQLDKMERQRAKDREEWRRKEEALVHQSNQMMEKLKETEGQLTMALKQEEEVRPYRSRSEEQLKQRRSAPRSASRSSYHHHQQQDEVYPEEEEQYPQEYPQEYPQDYYPEYAPKSSLSRRSSNASHRSRRSRSKSIESRREEEMAYSRPPSHPRRSRSAGRPKSPAPMYYDDDPRYYNEHAYYDGYYRHYGYADYYNQQYPSMRPAMAPSRSTQSRGYPGYYFR
ncbi:hypothetical protein K501DRAFT_335864 [Backusella circina FSU 941]|nr:hypothetical protein K501DRAFT_335864 [Backusella circina FSU 941]